MPKHTNQPPIPRTVSLEELSASEKFLLYLHIMRREVEMRLNRDDLDKRINV